MRGLSAHDPVLVRVVHVADGGLQCGEQLGGKLQGEVLLAAVLAPASRR